MANLKDMLDEKTLQTMQRAFSAVLAQPVSLCAPDGETIIPVDTDPAAWTAALGSSPTDALKRKFLRRPFRKSSSPTEIPIYIEAERVGMIRVLPGPAGADSAASEPLLRLLAVVLARLGEGGLELRRRVEQLLALQHVLAEIAGARELQEILDTVTKTTVKTMKAKAGSIRLLSKDGKELVIRAVHSIGPQYLDVNPIPLSQSPLDREVLESKEPVFVADMTTDSRVQYRKQAKREGFVSGLCAPMIFKDHREGVLRVFFRTRREVDWFERRLLQTIADSAAVAIANARLHAEARESWEIKRQLALASAVQQRMIPTGSPKAPGFDIHARYIPSQELAGDFYDFLRLSPDNLGIAICDVVGKGLRASLLMASIRASLRAHASNVYEMSDVLGQVNRDLCADTLSSDFATMFYGVLNFRTRVFTYACAGHMPPILVRDGKLCYLETQGGVLGVLPEMSYPLDHFQMKSGDIIFAYTDGVSEAVNFQHEPYGRARIEAALLSAVQEGYSAEATVAYCLWDLRRFAGLHRRADDRTLIAIKAL